MDATAVTAWWAECEKRGATPIGVTPIFGWWPVTMEYCIGRAAGLATAIQECP